MKPTEEKQILTVQDLMERWAVSRDTIFRQVDNPDHPLPCFTLGGGDNKNRSLVRFRIAAIRAWEETVERRAVKPMEPEAVPVGMPVWFDGEIHTGKQKKPKPKKSLA